MNKRLKKFLLLVLVLILAAGGSFAYKYYSIYKDITALPSDDDDQGASGATEEPVNPFDRIETEEDEGEEEDLPEGEGADSAPSAEGAEGQKDQSGDKPVAGEAEKAPADSPDQGKPGKKPTEQGGGSKPGKETYGQVVGSYKPRFESLEARQESELNALIGQAKAEYIKAKKNGKSVLKLGVKYLNKANGLESTADSEFKALNNEFKAELKRKNYSTEITGQMKKYYEQKKRSLRAGLMEQVKGL